MSGLADANLHLAARTSSLMLQSAAASFNRMHVPPHSLCHLRLASPQPHLLDSLHNMLLLCLSTTPFLCASQPHTPWAQELRTPNRETLLLLESLPQGPRPGDVGDAIAVALDLLKRANEIRHLAPIPKRVTMISNFAHAVSSVCTHLQAIKQPSNIRGSN